MGEYFSWVNIDRREYLDPSAFDDHLCKLYQTIWYSGMGHRALCTLLNREWKGQRILYLGDETEPAGDRGNPALKQLIEEHRRWGEPGYLFDYVEDSYMDISAQFVGTENFISPDIGGSLRHPEACTTDRLNPANPYAGLFDRVPQDFRYIVNMTKGEYLDRKHAQKGTVSPLPLLLAYVDFVDEPFVGAWIGDSLTAANDAPPDSFRDVSGEYLVNF